ncbi:MAG: hypothetical protein RLZZ501_2124 [Pseudomonadota bacterium]|jgi:peptide/nickel transport system permease protein
MSRAILLRLGQSLLVLLAMSVLIHALMGLMPGDPIDLMIAGDPRLTADDAARLKALYGLDRPWGERWLRWLAQAVQGEFGYSRLYGLPVAAALLPALGHTLQLMGAALTLSLAVALPLGILAARRPGGLLDGAATLLALGSVSVPVFWSGLMLAALFAVTLGWLPAGGLGALDGGGGDRLRHLILPATALALAGVGPLLRHLRAALLLEAGRDYLRTARAKGCGPWRVLLVHQLRNALLPVVTLVALEIGGLLSGALVTETVFAWPGMGRLIYDAVMGNDFNLALSGLLLATATTLAGSVLADLAYARLDPRMRRR